MKKVIYTFIIAFLFLFQIKVKAQPLFISSDITPVAGDVFTENRCYGCHSNVTGPNKIFKLGGNGTLPPFDTFRYVNPSSTPYGANYPNSNICLYLKYGRYYYYDAIPSLWQYTGTSVNGSIVTMPYELLRFPITYGDSMSDSFVNVTIVISTLTYQKVTTTVIVDGWGTYIGDGDTVLNSLRIHTKIHTRDSSSSGINNYYLEKAEWFAAGHHGPICSSPIFGGGGYTSYFHAVKSTGIDDIKNDAADFKVYPNPVINNASIQFTTNQNFEYDLHVYNMLGKDVMSLYHLSAFKGRNNFNIDINQLAAGSYIMQANNGKEMIASKKIIVVK